ncbi:glutamate carboxypeptidase-like protein [Nadsonia fulvescens var. elongata DSM 6958]|uniref:Glutamate carboxypeptidase-like protein n=1 Tax=Nadsonia fulvescens var. elongata DSM 6958 TaxID=857566 RepID=A0A1E3PPE0_9ASCO|nr:glutamate carboxypeptidase-like protein [Nadsonia fulvescens var. elongata DSM 6958]
MSQQCLDTFFAKVDHLQPAFIDRLAKAVAIPSVSSEPERRHEVVRMGEFLRSELTALGATDIQMQDLGPQEDTDMHLPPVVLARYGTDANKLNILVYGHYDVQPADLEDGWDTDPFTLVQDGDKLLGRGSTDDKGPVLGWLNVIQAHQEAGIEFPVNLVMCFEGMEEYGSLGLEEMIEREKDVYFKGVDAVCISDNYWLGTENPVITYGLRGCNYYSITVEGPGADLHSGLFGGIVNEPMIDLSHLFSKLVTSQGKILIPGVQEMVAPLTAEEDARYDTIQYELDDLHNATGGQKINLYDTPRETLQHRWREPSLSIHGLEGAFSHAGAKTVIPAKVVGKFSIRTVPNIDSAALDKLVIDYVHDEFAKLGSKCRAHCTLMHDGAYWVSDPDNWNFTAARRATKAVWGVEPDLTREGGSIPITIAFEKALNTSCLLLPMGRGDDGAHSINEKINLSNYIQGIKTLGAYLHYVSVADR